MLSRAHWSILFWGCAAVVLVLSLMPTVPQMPTTGWDKSNHVLAFAVLAVLGCRAYPARLRIVLTGLMFYGGLIEVLQSLTTYRFAEWADLVADGVGIIVGAGLDVVARRFRRGGPQP